MTETRLLDLLKQHRIHGPTLGEAIDSESDRAFEILAGAAYQESRWFTDGVLDALLARFDRSPRDCFSILHAVAASEPARADGLLSRFRTHFDRRPSDAIDALYYICTNDPGLLDVDLVRRLCTHATTNPYQAFSALQHVLMKRPELVDEAVVRAVLDNLGRAVNQAFYFIREAVKRRPEFVPLCTLALFECVLLEPHPYVKREMIKDIVSIATASHVKTGLERTLRETPMGGTSRARALMAILFRQRFRMRQRVLLESLDLAAQYPAMWDFLMFLLDRPDLKQTTSAAAEEFLESAYRLNLLVEGHEFETLVSRRLDLREPKAIGFPDDVAFLAKEPGLLDLYRRVVQLASKLESPLQITPIDLFRGRLHSTQRERNAIQKVRADATTRRRKKLETREEELARRVDRWSDPRYLKAFGDPEAEAALDPAAKRALHIERHELAKKVGDALRAAAPSMALSTLKAAMFDAFRSAVRHVLGRDYAVERIDPDVLPAFMYHERIGKYPKNRKWLARLIQDRIEGVPHTWMWTEPAAHEWSQKVKKSQPAATLERWRAEFRREYGYAAANVEREKQKRIERDLVQTRALFDKLKLEDPVDPKAGYDVLRREFLKLREKPPKDADPQVIQEIENNLERIRIAQQSSDSDYEGKIALEVETDPIKVLFMGEYGFASCLSIRGANVWSAVSNAIDIDKAIVWAKEGEGNIVGRRLIALAPEGLVSFRTYANRHGLALDPLFDKFLDEYAAHLGVKQAHGVKIGPLLSDKWYDDGAL